MKTKDREWRVALHPRCPSSPPRDPAWPTSARGRLGEATLHPLTGASRPHASVTPQPCTHAAAHMLNQAHPHAQHTAHCLPAREHARAAAAPTLVACVSPHVTRRLVKWAAAHLEHSADEGRRPRHQDVHPTLTGPPRHHRKSSFGSQHPTHKTCVVGGAVRQGCSHWT